MDAPKSTGEQAQYLTFRIDQEEFAIPVLRVREILQFDHATKIPNTPAAMRGVINLRGNVVAVLDLAVVFGRPPTVPNKKTCVVIIEAALEGKECVLGLLVDCVSEVLELSSKDIQPPPAFGASVDTRYIVGMAEVGRGFVLVLDMNRLLMATDTELLTQDERKKTDPIPVAATVAPQTPPAPSP